MATYKLNMIPGDAPVVVPVNQYDTGYTISFELYNGNTAFSLAGCSARIDIGKADNTIYSSGDSVSLSGNTVTVTLEEQMTTMWGPCIAEIVVLTSTGRHATANFILDVEKSPIEDGAESESMVNYVEANRARAIEATAAAEAATAAAETATEAATQAAEDALSAVENIESMPDELRSLASMLAQPGDAVKFLGFNSSYNAIAFDAGYVTPQMYGAKGDGTTNDTSAFQAAIASGKKVVVPSGTYKLTSVLFSDDSIVISDAGAYPNKKFIISRNLREDAPVERLVGQFDSSLFNVEDYRLQGGCYDSKNDRIVLAFCDSYQSVTDDTDLVLTAYKITNGVDIEADVFAIPPEIDPITGEEEEDPRNGDPLSVVITGGGHGNSLCYNPDTNKIYSVTGNGNLAHQIAVIDADTLEFESWIAPVTDGSRVWRIAYDDVYKIYYIETYNGTTDVLTAFDENFNNLGTGFPLGGNEAKEIAGLHYGTDHLNANATAVIDHQVIQVHYSARGADTPAAGNSAYLTQYNYADGSIKKIYRIQSKYLYDEPQCIVNADGRIYMFTDIGNDARRFVSVAQLVFDRRVSGESVNPYADARVMATSGWWRDLNDLLTVGMYYVASGENAQAWRNRPCNRGFSLFVLPFLNVFARLQIAVDSTAEVYIRAYSPQSDTWTSWRKITTTTVSI